MMLIAALAAALLFLFLREAYARIWSQCAFASLTVEESSVYAGEEVHLTEIVENRSRIPFPETEVRFRMPQGPVFRDAENVVVSDYVYKRDLFSLRPKEQIRRRYVLTCPRRGEFPLSSLTLRARSFLHRRHYEKSLDTAAKITVYAGWTDVSGILARCDTLLGEVQSRRRLLEDPFSFSSIRTYTPQDPLRAVNWKASARAGELMVNTFASVQDTRFCICLDRTDDRIRKQEELIELGIRTAASLCRKMIGRGMETGLSVYGDEAEAGELPPARGKEQLKAMEQLLCRNAVSRQKAGGGPKPGASAGFAPWAYRQAAEQSDNRIYVFISKEEDSLTDLERLLRAGNGGVPACRVLVQPLAGDNGKRLRLRILE